MATITVTGIAHKPTGDPSELVRFVRRQAPDMVGDVTVTGHITQTVPDADDGTFSVDLYEGRYKYFPWTDCKSPLSINVTATPSTQAIEDIVEDYETTTGDVPLQFYTLAGLRARTRHEDQGDTMHGVMLAYGVTPGDGKAGLFRFSGDSTADDDAGLNVIKPTDIDTADPGRWIRLS